MPRAEARGAHWVKPKLVAEVAFAEFTADGVAAPRQLPRPPRRQAGRGSGGRKAAAGARRAPEDDVKISNPERLVFPDANGSPRASSPTIIRAVAPLMLPWAANRPLISLVRCPRGRGKKCFFQKHDAGTFGAHVHHIPIAEKNGEVEDYLYVDEPAGIVTCVQMGTIEFHGWGSRVADVEKPDRLVFDIDPDEGLGFDKVKKAARDI